MVCLLGPVAAVKSLSPDHPKQPGEHKRFVLHDLAGVYPLLNHLHDFKHMVVNVSALTLSVRYVLQLLKFWQEIRKQVVIIAQLQEPEGPFGKSFHYFASPAFGRNVIHPVSLNFKEFAYIALSLPENIHLELCRKSQYAQNSQRVSVD